MKFTGNPSADLGIGYHAWAEKDNGDGTYTVRYTLSKKLTNEQIEELSQYENIKVVKDGAQLRYAPEMKYDVLYIRYDEEPEDEVATEDIEPESEYEDENSLIDAIDEEVGIPSTPNDDSRYAILAQGVSLENDSIIYYNQLKEMFPEDSQVIQDIIDEELKHVGQLQALMNKNPNVLQNFSKGIEEGEKQIAGIPDADPDSATEAIGGYKDPRFKDLEDLVVKKIQESILDEETKEDTIDDIRINGIDEYMGYLDDDGEIDTSRAEADLKDEASMNKAADDYVSLVVKVYSEVD